MAVRPLCDTPNPEIAFVHHLDHRRRDVLETGTGDDLDAKILEYLSEEGRASPTLFMRAKDIDTSRQWVSSRFTRLAEHNHIRYLYDTGIYELVEDPREERDLDG